MSGKALIGQALELIVSRRACSYGDALHWLQTKARERGQKLEDAALDVLDHLIDVDS